MVRRLSESEVLLVEVWQIVAGGWCDYDHAYLAGSDGCVSGAELLDEMRGLSRWRLSIPFPTLEP